MGSPEPPASALSSPTAAPAIGTPSADDPEFQLRHAAEVDAQARATPRSRTDHDREPTAEASSEARTGKRPTQGSSSTPPRPFATPAGSNVQGEPDSAQRPLPYDGRVRNPVPRLLQNLDGRKGNFAVMNIDVNKAQISERDAAAKRTSQGTEAAARIANKDGYQSVKRSRLAFIPADGAQQSSPQPSQPVHTGPQSGYGYGPPYQQPRPPPPPALASGLSPNDTKAEQARLLTLLRSLHPALVVDRLCQAVAFFGGIPDAPPPGDGGFPESAVSNGTGHLFIGWVSEIFPPANRPLMPGQAAPPPGHPASGVMGSSSGLGDMQTAVKKGRGRPKGSKSKHARKDKGVKKSGQGPSAGAPSGSAGDARSTVGDGTGVAPIDVEEMPQTQVDSTATSTRPGGTQPTDPNFGVSATPGSKKRGRPKGSKNRPKDATRAISDPNNSNHAQAMPQTSAQISPQVPSANPGASAAAQTQSRPAPAVPYQAPSSTTPPRNTAAGPGAPAPTAPAQQQNHPTGETQASQANKQGNGANGTGTSRKRKATRPAQNGGQEPTLISGDGPDTHDQGPANAMPTAASARGPQAKRRRTSRETTRAPGQGNSGSQPPASDMSVPPVVHANMDDGGVQRNRLPAEKSPPSQAGQQQHQPQQRQPEWGHQQARSQQHQHAQTQPSPDLSATNRSPQQGSMNNVPGASRAGQRLQGPYGTQQQQQQPPANMNAQAFFPQQMQMPNGYGQLGSNMAANVQNFQQRQGMSRPGLGAMAPPRRGRQSNGQKAVPPSSSTSATTTPTTAPATSSAAPELGPGMAQLQGSFGPPNGFLGMGYGGAAAFGADQRQLEAALAEPGAREHVFRAMGR